MIYGILFIAIVCLAFGFVAGFLWGRTSEMTEAINEMKRTNATKRAELALLMVQETIANIEKQYPKGGMASPSETD